jgi:hypothetical protein
MAGGQAASKALRNAFTQLVPSSYRSYRSYRAYRAYRLGPQPPVHRVEKGKISMD